MSSPVAPPAEQLRQMLAVLEQERQALAALDLDGLLASTFGKQQLCAGLDGIPPAALDEECRALLRAARHQNEVNRKLRNLLAANVAARIEALSGSAGLYAPGAARLAAR